MASYHHHFYQSKNVQDSNSGYLTHYTDSLTCDNEIMKPQEIIFI